MMTDEDKIRAQSLIAAADRGEWRKDIKLVADYLRAENERRDDQWRAAALKHCAKADRCQGCDVTRSERYNEGRCPGGCFGDGIRDWRARRGLP